MDLFDNIGPLDYRYYGRNEKEFEKLKPFLSENARINYQLKVELALIKTLAKRGICSDDVVKEVEEAVKKVTAKEVYEEEDRIRHDIRSLANSIRNKVSDKAKPFVHFTSTSFDIVNTAEALRFKEFSEVLIETMKELEKTLIEMARREKDTVQIGRTHGQHGDPITFGFAIAEYVSRFGNCIKKVKDANLVGKFSGAVGAYNASSLFFDDPEEFEKEILGELGLKPATHSTQITEPEYTLDFIHSIVSGFGVIANLADDMRNLQRSEIAEIGEAFEAKQVGSSTMPHKRNPINFENVKSMWKQFMPRINTVYMDQISEHQRDLTNSASSRFIPELLAGFYLSIKRLNKTMAKMSVDKDNLQKNFDINKEMVLAEAIYIILAAHNHPDAHEYVRELTLESQKTGKPPRELLNEDPDMKQFLDKFTDKQKEIINSPEKYIGIASEKTVKVCNFWEKELKL
ncbi:MAG: adenylosuccinate lyase [Candidatus Aenigmarchaeota archaeon]|nr:adenylosuccinate lyase [Candidatus Aenigmarchaeota archaeon]